MSCAVAGSRLRYITRTASSARHQLRPSRWIGRNSGWSVFGSPSGRSTAPEPRAQVDHQPHGARRRDERGGVRAQRVPDDHDVVGVAQRL